MGANLFFSLKQIKGHSDEYLYLYIPKAAMKPSVILQTFHQKGSPEQELKVRVMSTESSFDFGPSFRSDHQIVSHFMERGQVARESLRKKAVKNIMNGVLIHSVSIS